MQKINLILLVIIIFFTLSCNKVEDLSEYKGETIVAKEAEIKAIEPKLEEVALYDGKCQFGGVSQEKKEYYIIDYLSEMKDDFYLLKVYDLDSLKLKKTVKLKFGDYMAPNEYRGILGGVEYSNGKYYILNEKVSIFDGDFKYLDCTFFEPPPIGSKESFDNRFCFIDYISNKDTDYMSQGWMQIHSDKKRVKLISNKIFMYKINSKWRGRSGVDSKLYECIDNVDYIGTHKSASGKAVLVLNYFAPKSFGFTFDNNIIYGINTRQGYFKQDPFLKKKVFVKLPWLKIKENNDDNALKIGTFKEENRNKSTKSNIKFDYVSTNAKLFYYWLLRENNKIALVSQLFIDKNSFRVDFVNIDNGDYIKSLILPYGQHFTRLLFAYRVTIPQFYIDLERGLYIYGDRDEDWNEVVRVCRFKEES